MTLAERPINFTRGVPADESYPNDQIAECVADAMRGPLATKIMQYGPSLGFAPLRDWLAARHNVGLDQVLVANGSLQILDFLGLAVIEPNDVVFVESPTYDRTITLLRRHRANVIGIPAAADGIDLDVLEARLQEHTPKLLYVIPDFQNPSGATTSQGKRERIAQLAEQHGFWIVEDAPYRPLRYRGDQLPSIQEIAPDRTLHMSSFTKQISPGVRVGYMIGAADVLKQLAKAAEDTYITPNELGAAAVYEFCQRGWLEPQIDRLRALYGERLTAIIAALREHLPTAQWIEPDGGFFVSITLPEGLTGETLRARAADLKLNLSDGRGFFPDPAQGERFLRLPFCALTPDEINEGVRRVAAAVAG